MISNTFVELLLYLFDTNKINIELYNKLTPNEQDILDFLTNKSSINISSIRHNKEEIDSLINRYNVVSGEILIGNNNPELLKELKQVSIKLFKYNLIKISDLHEILEQLFYLI